MYDTALIEDLKERIGFGSPMYLPDEIEVDEKHIKGESGRTFGYFHRLVSLENLYKTIGRIESDSDRFNEYLDQLKEDAVKSVLNELINRCSECVFNNKLRKDLRDSPSFIDDAIGYSLATSAIEEMIASSRINREERSGLFKYDKLKIELEGMHHQDGNIISEGIKAKKFRVMRYITDTYCKEGLIIEDANAW